MNESGLQFFDIEKMVRNLNSQLSDSSAIINLSDIQNKKPKKFSPSRLLDKLTDSEIEEKGKYILSVPYEIAVFHPFKEQERIGHIIVERGCTDISSDYGGIYETIKLRTKRALELKKGKVIPECTIWVMQEADDGAQVPEKRIDYVRHGLLYWKKADLSEIVPSEWFLNAGKSGRY